MLSIAAMTSWCEAVSQYQEDAHTPSPLGDDLQWVPQPQTYDMLWLMSVIQTSIDITLSCRSSFKYFLKSVKKSWICVKVVTNDMHIMVLCRALLHSAFELFLNSWVLSRDGKVIFWISECFVQGADYLILISVCHSILLRVHICLYKYENHIELKGLHLVPIYIPELMFIYFSMIRVF